MPTAKEVQKAARSWIEETDEVVRDIPVFQYAIQLQDTIFSYADELGLGDEIRTLIYGIRTVSYAAGVGAPFLASVTAGVGAGAGIGGAAAVGAGAGVLASTGVVGALGVVGVIAVALSWILGGGESDAEKNARKAAQQRVLHLKGRLTLQQFAEEQDAVAAGNHVLASFPQAAIAAAAHANELRASRLASFYRKASSELSPGERGAFESMANLGRWQGAIEHYKAMPKSKRDALDIQFGKSADTLPWQLKPAIDKETAWLAARLAALQAAASLLMPKHPKSWISSKSLAAAARRSPAAQRRSAGGALLGMGLLAAVGGAVYYSKGRGLLP